MAGDETIVDDDELWRYVHPTQILHDRIKNRYRPQSGAFIDRNTVAAAPVDESANGTGSNSRDGNNRRRCLALWLTFF